MVTCCKKVSLPGGYIYMVSRVRVSKPCFYCRKDIAPLSVVIVEERFRVDRRLYHPECFLKQYGYRFSLRRGPGGLEICCED